jgi:hypothetical protein
MTHPNHMTAEQWKEDGQSEDVVSNVVPPNQTPPSVRHLSDAEYRAAKAKAIATAHNPPPPPALRNALELSPAEYRRELSKLGIWR